MADSASFWDNSRHDGPRTAALFSDGLVVGSPGWPAWAPKALTDLWPIGGTAASGLR
jgi:predicted ABC-type ATPase